MPDRLQEIRARLHAAYPGPLLAGTRNLHAAHEQMMNEIDGRRAFIAHAPADIAWLLDEVEAWRGHCGCCDCQRMRGGEVIGCECPRCKRYRAGGS